MEKILFEIIEYVALGIGIVGIIVILIGALHGLWVYVTRSSHYFSRIRIILGKHLILGLDFLVGKDVIDTLLLHPGKDFYQHLLSLITIVAIRPTLRRCFSDDSGLNFL